MRLRLGYLALAVAAVVALTGCPFGGSEPSEDEMKQAMLDNMNHPPGIDTPVVPISIKFFKKGACNKPNEQGYHCTFDVTVQSENALAGLYDNVKMGDFYKDKDGKWAMRSPF